MTHTTQEWSKESDKKITRDSVPICEDKRQLQSSDLSSKASASGSVASSWVEMQRICVRMPHRLRRDPPLTFQGYQLKSSSASISCVNLLGRSTRNHGPTAPYYCASATRALIV